MTLDNRTPTAADKLIITLPTPDGALALPGLGQLSPTQGWRWNLDSLAGAGSAVLTGTLRINRRPMSGALLLHVQSTANNVPKPVEAVGGVMVIDRSLGPSTTPFNPGAGAVLRSRDGRIRVDVPARAATRPLTLRHGRTPLTGARVPRAVFAGGRRGIGSFFLDATDAQGAAVHQFAEPITITVSYTPEQLQVLGFNEATLSLYWFDEAENAWVGLPTQIDSEAHTARAQVNHFSAYNLSDGSSPSAAFIPSLQGFQVGAYTGAATYSIPIDVPAGAGGLKPSINLGYSSAATDGSAGTRLAWQAGWAGKGWDWEYPGYPTANTNFQQNTPHEIYRLDKIKIQSSADGVSYAQMGEYRLRYADTLTASLQTDQAPTNPSGQKVLTLVGVRRFGKDGLTALPETTFAYQLNEFAQFGTTQVPAPGWNRLLTVDNGEGGKLTFTYEHTWLPAQLAPGENYVQFYANYYRVTGVLTQDTSGQGYSKSALTTYDYTSGGQNTAAVNDQNHAATVVYARYPPSDNGDSRQYLARPEKREFRGHWYVAEKQYDGATTAAPLLQDVRHWFYQGNGGSANAVCTPAHGLYSSHNEVLAPSELNPANPSACFQQMFRNEAFKGREYQTDIRDAAGALLQQRPAPTRSAAW